MSEVKTYPVPADFAAQANITADQYEEMYKRSVEDPAGFWGEQAEQYLTWFKKWDSVLDWSFDKEDLHINWFKGGKLNVSYNCLDRHLESRGDQVAIIWEGDDPNEDRKITYKELHEEVCKFANVLKDRGVKKGDRVSLYLPMIPEAAVAMLACTRIGAMHSIVFGGFSPDSLADRIVDSSCEFLITTDGVMRGAKAVPLKGNADEAMNLAGKQGVNVRTCIVYERVGSDKVKIDKDVSISYTDADRDVSERDADAGADGRAQGDAQGDGLGFLFFAHARYLRSVVD